MGKWEEKKLQDVCERITDGTHQTPTYFDQGYIFLSSKNVTSQKIDWENVRYVDEKQYLEFQKRISPKVGDILLAKNGTTGVAAMVDRDVPFNIYVSLAWLRSKGDVIPEYLLYFINSPNAKKQFNSRLKGVGVPNLHLKEIREVKMAFPKSLTEQQRIVAKLDGLFAKIDQAIGLLEENIAHTQALMGSVLDEEFGKLECESHLLKKISDKIQYGYTGKTKEKGQYYYLRITDIQDGKVDFNKAPFSDILKEEASKYILNQGDILFARTGATAGKSYLFNDEEPSIFASYLIRVVVKQDKLSPKYLKWYFQSDEYWSQIFGNIVGAAQPNFNGKKLGELIIPVPSLKIQDECVLKFEQYDKVIRSSIETQTQKLTHLKALKSSLLDQAFKGEL
tara:strand:- start:7388 stop:8569 length:1182 start_codon:yes stop_codon:yes gene_type:complete